MGYILVKTRSGLVKGVKAHYYSWSGENPPKELLGLTPLKEDVDEWINHVWWDSPIPGVPAEFFAIAWLGFIRVPSGGEYRFYVTTDDGSRVWVDGKLLIDAWKDQPPTTYVSEPVFLEEGYHRLKYYFYNRYAFAEAVLGWIPPHGSAGPIPKEAYYHNVSSKVSFTNLPEGYVVELIVGEEVVKKCTSHEGACEIPVIFDEMPLMAKVRITDESGREVFTAEKPIVLFGGDEYRATLVG